MSAPGDAAFDPAIGGAPIVDPGSPLARLRWAGQRWLHREQAAPIWHHLARGTAVLAERRARRRPPAPAVPTIVVGALSVGGAGKTPVVLWLARRLAERGRVVVLGHGHGGRARRPTVVDRADAAAFGDEAAALFRAVAERDLPITLVVGGDRAARHRWASSRADVIVVDDGFQDPTLPRTADLVVVDATAGRRVMPAGPLREPLSALGRADGIWLHKIDEPGAAALPGWSPSVTSRWVTVGVRLPDGRRVEPDWLAGREVRPLCAIGRPGSFFHRLAQHGARLLPGCVRADHHVFSPRELGRLPPGQWVTTTKDHARLPEGFAAAVLEVDVQIASGGDWLEARLDAWGAGGSDER